MTRSRAVVAAAAVITYTVSGRALADSSESSKGGTKKMVSCR
jgi:hypothetical protein